MPADQNYDPATTPIAEHGYAHALTAAGATVHAFKMWIDPGDVAGDFLACVTLPNSRTGWVHGWPRVDDEDVFKVDAGDHAGQPDYWECLIGVGEYYLDDLYDWEQVEEEIGWATDSGEVDEMLAFIRRVSADVGLPPPPADDGE